MPAAESTDDAEATDQLGEVVLAHQENDNYARAHAAQDVATSAPTNKPSEE